VQIESALIIVNADGAFQSLCRVVRFFDVLPRVLGDTHEVHSPFSINSEILRRKRVEYAEEYEEGGGVCLK